MVELNLIDKAFDLKNTSDYHLSIQLGLDGFSFCILDLRTKKYVVLKHIPLIVGKPQFLVRKVEAIFNEDEKLNVDYHSVGILMVTNRAGIIPKEFSDQLFDNGFPVALGEIEKFEDFHVIDIPGFDQNLYFNYPKEILTFINHKFTQFSFKHISLPLIASAMYQRNEKRNRLVINFEKNILRIIAIKDGLLTLHNTFYFKNETDFLFHTLNIFNTLHFKPETDEVLIGGYVADDSVFIRQLKKYIQNIVFLKPSLDFSYGALFEKIQKHQFVSLLNNYPCE
jgi:hypothetical protein